MTTSLTPGAISKLFTGKCTSDDLKPVVQVIDNDMDRSPIRSNDDKQWYLVGLSDGSFKEFVAIDYEILISNKLQQGSIIQLTNYDIAASNILVSDLTVIHSKCGFIGDPELLPDNETPLVERTTPTIPDNDHANLHQVEESPTSKQKHDHVNSHVNVNIDDSRHHVEEPATSKQKPSASTQKYSFHSITRNNTNKIMGVNLTPGAITKITTDKCSSTDLKPVVQVTNILSGRISTKNDKQCYRKFVLSDGSSSHFGCIADDIFMSKKLQKGSIIQLAVFHFTKFSIYGNIRVLLIMDVNVIHSKCDIIVNPEPFPRNDIPLAERSTPPINVDVSHAKESMTSTQKCSETQSRKRKHQSSNETPESDTNEDVNDSDHANEPLAITQKCSSDSLTQIKNIKCQSSNDNISKVVEDVSKMTKLMMEKNRKLDVGFKKLETLEEEVSRMTRMMIEKNKEDDVGACYKKMEILEDDVGACFKKLEVLEEDVSKLTRMMMEKSKEDDVGTPLKKLEVLQEDVSKLTRLMMEKYKEDDIGACIEKLDKIGWVAQDPMYDTALLLFGQSADYRKLWLHLKPESCGNWVKNAGSMFGLLD